MMKTLLVVGFALCTVSTFGEPKYPVSAIPAELRANMNAVVREDVLVFKITARSKAVQYIHQVITIFNENGKEHAQAVIDYDKLRKIKGISGAVYDAAGNTIRKLKSSEIIDQSLYDGFSLFSDNRLKHFDLAQGMYPYTVEYEYEIEHKFLFFVPSYYALPGGKVSTQHSTYTLQYPANAPELAPRYFTVGVDKQPTKTQSKDGFIDLTWTIENMMPVKTEPMGPKEAELIPHIKAAPSAFEYEGYVGTMDNWDKFGQWIISLNKGRDALPEATRQKIRDITKNLTTDEQKIKAVYEYLQNKTRYVSIQLGIGGFQPFEASVVDQTGYGDCKALSNYTVALLEAVGIKANYTLISAGRDGTLLNSDFPSSQFNHAVVFVPTKTDTIWLECTSQTNPFGYMGTFTGDRRALAITNEGAKVVYTPKYPADKNIQSTNADVTIDKSGNAKAKITSLYAGLQYENGGLSFVLSDQFDDQKKWVQKNTDIPNFDVNSFSMVNHKDRIPSATVNLDLSLNRLAFASGKRLFITPNLMNRSTYIPDKVETRKNPVYRKTGYIDVDTIRYHVPEDIYPEFLPEAVTLKTRFGEYKSEFIFDQGSVLYIRKLVMNKGTFPADSYNELVNFYKGINKADNVKLVFLSKT